jgi:hypothetical protein
VRLRPAEWHPIVAGVFKFVADPTRACRGWRTGFGFDLDLEFEIMLTVMIAEKDLLMADMLEESLLDAGYQVCGIARTVAEGIALGELHRPDLAVLDLRLRHGGLGTEIAAQLDRKSVLGILYATGMRGKAY